jgi:hypothetical protein
LNIFLLRSELVTSLRNKMEERYKDTIILISTDSVGKNMRWKPTCKVKFVKDRREVLEEIKLDLDYDTVEQAERAGLVFAKKWVDLKLRPNRRSDPDHRLVKGRTSLPTFTQKPPRKR